MHRPLLLSCIFTFHFLSPMDLAPIIARKAERFRELDNAIADPALFDQPARARATLREHTQLRVCWTAGPPVKRRRPNATRTSKCPGTKPTPNSPRWRPRNSPRSTPNSPGWTAKSNFNLLPPDPNEDRDAIVEIRAGTGGSEAALFRRRPAPHVHALRGKPRPEDRADGFQPVGVGRVEGSGVSACRASRCSGGCVTRAACTASSACPRPRRRGASTRPRRPWPCCPRRRRSNWN